MPEKKTIERAKVDASEGKAPGTQAGEFVRQEIEHIRKGKHGARSSKQAIAIGLSKGRRAGVRLPPPAKGKVLASTRENAERDYRKGQATAAHKPSPARSRAIVKALQREGHSAASPLALARHARASARKRGKAARSQAALKGVRTKGIKGLQQAARKAARTRAASRRKI
jgi:hypothetical protein